MRVFFYTCGNLGTLTEAPGPRHTYCSPFQNRKHNESIHLHIAKRRIYNAITTKADNNDNNDKMGPRRQWTPFSLIAVRIFPIVMIEILGEQLVDSHGSRKFGFLRELRNKYAVQMDSLILKIFWNCYIYFFVESYLSLFLSHLITFTFIYWVFFKYNHHCNWFDSHTM